MAITVENCKGEIIKEMEEEWKWTGYPCDLITPSLSNAEYKERDSRFHTCQTKEMIEARWGRGSLNMF